MLAPSGSHKKLSSGSATGNPRNKCALEPGHSLMDWIRLSNSGVDLSGTRGALIPVSSAELAKHCLRTDAWMAIRGKVFNVTRYMDFHPGGADELMRGVGQDATKLFDQVHAWVNYEQLLAKCLIGPLRNVVKINADDLGTLSKPKTNLANGTFQIPKMDSLQLQQPTQIIPRFDWIQKRSDISIYFYTKQFCNPGLVITYKSAKEFSLQILIESHNRLYNFELQHEIIWPPNVLKIASESGKIEVTFKKTISHLWTSYGNHNSKNNRQLEDLTFEFKIVHKKAINHNSFEMVLSGQRDIIVPPIGCHFSISANVCGETVSRNYTPVPQQFSTFTEDVVPTANLVFFIKTYTNGLLAKHIDGLEIASELHLSQPKGAFKFQTLLAHNRIVLLAAGSGITPMLPLLEHLLARSSNKVENILLLFFNKTEQDIWCKDVLNKLCNDRFKCINILSQPSTNWTGKTGRISKELLAPIINPQSAEYSTFSIICGPPAFNEVTEKLLNSIEFKDDNIYVFGG